MSIGSVSGSGSPYQPKPSTQASSGSDDDKKTGDSQQTGQKKHHGHHGHHRKEATQGAQGSTQAPPNPNPGNFSATA
jgi:hypothetical protein